MEYEKKIAPDGSKLSGFVKAEQNRPPRDCKHCVFYAGDRCHNELVQLDPEVLGEQGKPKPVNDEDCCNHFASKTKTLLYAVRHGETLLNAQKKFRGWTDVELNDQGKAEAYEVGQWLKDHGGASMVYCSDLPRAIETAQTIADALGIERVWQDARLRPWNLGELTGKDRSEENKKELDLYVDNPGWIIPGGESLEQFSDRCQEALEFYLHEARNEGLKVLVFHTSNVCQLECLCDGEKGTANPEGQDSIDPGGIIKVEESKGKLKATPVLKENGKAEYGAS